MSLHRRKRGSVLLIALLMMAVIAGIAADILLRGRAEIRHSIEASAYDRFYLDVQGYQYWAIRAFQDYKEKEANTPSPFNSQSFEWGAQIVGEWQDQQALFNINALKGNEQVKKCFMNFLIRVGKVEEGDARLILRDIEKYLSQNERMLSISELRAIKRISQELFLKLQRYLTALPNHEHKININNVNGADPSVLLTLSEEMTLEQTKAFIFCRSGFIKETESAEFINCLKQKNLPFNSAYCGYSSHFFLAVAYIKIGSQQHSLYTFLEKIVSKDKSFVRLLWQSQDSK